MRKMFIIATIASMSGLPVSGCTPRSDENETEALTEQDNAMVDEILSGSDKPIPGNETEPQTQLEDPAGEQNQ